jgi:hypothetical protein
MFGNPETTPGGRALKFFSTIRLDIRRKDQIKAPDGRVVGNRTKIKVVKNKVAPPFTECEVDLMYDEGLSRVASIIDLGLQCEAIERKGTWLSFRGELLGQGRDAAMVTLRQKPALGEAILVAAKEDVAPVVVEVSATAIPPVEPTEEAAFALAPEIAAAPGQQQAGASGCIPGPEVSRSAVA